MYLFTGDRPGEVSMFRIVWETMAAFLSITNSNPSALISFTMSSFIFTNHQTTEFCQKTCSLQRTSGGYCCKWPYNPCISKVTTVFLIKKKRKIEFKTQNLKISLGYPLFICSAVAQNWKKKKQSVSSRSENLLLHRRRTTYY